MAVVKNGNRCPGAGRFGDAGEAPHGDPSHDPAGMEQGFITDIGRGVHRRVDANRTRQAAAVATHDDRRYLAGLTNKIGD